MNLIPKAVTTIIDTIRETFDMKPEISVLPQEEVDHLSEDDDDDDLYDDDEFYMEDLWEDEAGMEELKQKLKVPEGWFFVKCPNFSNRTFNEVAEWCDDNCEEEWRKFGWSSGCSTKVGVAFESKSDACMFKLRWR